MVPSLAVQAGALGEALAGHPGRGAARRARRATVPGPAVRGRPAGRGPARRRGPRTLVTPDGDHVTAGLMPLGELVAAQRASGAPDVDSASSEVPHGRLVRRVLPVASRLLAIAPLRRFAARRLAAVRLPGAARAARALLGPRRGRLGRTARPRRAGCGCGEAQAATDAVAAEVARRLAARRRAGPGPSPRRRCSATASPPSLGGTWTCTDGVLPRDPRERRRSGSTSRRGTFRVGPAPYPTPGPARSSSRRTRVALEPGRRRARRRPPLRLPVAAPPRRARHGRGRRGGRGRARRASRRQPSRGRRPGGGGFASGQERFRNDPAHGAFQRFVVLAADLTARVPDDVGLVDAAVLPLGPGRRRARASSSPTSSGWRCRGRGRRPGRDRARLGRLDQRREQRGPARRRRRLPRAWRRPARAAPPGSAALGAAEVVDYRDGDRGRRAGRRPWRATRSRGRWRSGGVR